MLRVGSDHKQCSIDAGQDHIELRVLAVFGNPSRDRQRSVIAALRTLAVDLRPSAVGRILAVESMAALAWNTHAVGRIRKLVHPKAVGTGGISTARCVSTTISILSQGTLAIRESIVEQSQTGSSP